MKTDEKILRALQKNGAVSVETLSTTLKISRQYLHRKLKEMLEQNKVIKMGEAPHVFYSLAPKSETKNFELVPYEKEQFLNQHFMIIDALGNQLSGLAAMKYFTSNQHLPLLKTIDEYIETRKKYLTFYNNEHLIDGLEKLKNTKDIGTIGVDELYYLDFYAIERFGKTNLGCLMHYAKQGQNKQLMKIIADEINNRLLHFINLHQIDAVLFVTPTIPRKVQIMSALEKLLNLGLPTISVRKVSNAIAIPQKALSKLYERVANARNTFVVLEQKKYKNILILDDAIGSGATINEIAKKLKDKKIAQHIIGLAITGSYKGFEVISEL
jgi:DNA-binding Lrp family transcriptional regulator